MKLPFVKMHGLGNDFVVLDQRTHTYALSATQLAALADRRFGIGCDQILSLDPPTLAGAAVRYRVFNADGTSAEHCGNGVRCVARYLARCGALAGATVRVEIADELFELTLLDDGLVRVDMGPPRFAPATIPLAVATEMARYPLTLAGRQYEFGAVSLGNPHAVFAVPDVASAPVADIGLALQAHALFPRRVNVGFMQVLAPDRLRLRVFERGAGETKACGTGACAAMAIGRRWGQLGAAVTVELPGGNLQIDWDGDLQHALWMTGPATFVFEGTIEI